MFSKKCKKISVGQRVYSVSTFMLLMILSIFLMFLPVFVFATVIGGFSFIFYAIGYLIWGEVQESRWNEKFEISNGRVAFISIFFALVVFSLLGTVQSLGKRIVYVEKILSTSIEAHHK